MGVGLYKKLLVIGFTWPEPASTAAGNRMFQLLLFFRAEGYKITFACTAAESPLSLDLDTLDILRVPILLNHKGFDLFIADLGPDIVLFDRFLTEEQFGWRVAEFAPNAVRILDTEDLHSLRRAREKAFKSGLEYSIDAWLKEDMTKREVASIYRSDFSLIISNSEIDLLKNTGGVDDSLLFHLPFMIPKLADETIADWPLFEERSHFMCIGTGKHAPNVDAIAWLQAEIWPQIRQNLPKAELHVYGSYLPQQVLEMHRPSDGFYVKGWTADVEKTMAHYKVNLAPLRFGAGIKGKLVDGMRFGLPSITTVIGAEGMHGALRWNGLITNGATNFARAAVELHQNKSVWEEAQQQGVDLINSWYNESHLSKKFADRIRDATDHMAVRRTQNLFGSILQHHTLTSTKYLSKWIEEKNKNLEK